MRNLKALALAFVAVFALSAMAASAAQGHPAERDSDRSHSPPDIQRLHGLRPTGDSHIQGLPNRAITRSAATWPTRTTLTPSSPNDIDLNTTITGIHFEEHGALCPDGNTVAGNNMTLNGKITIKAINTSGESIDAQVTGTEEFGV